jgi:hypothetical protein
VSRPLFDATIRSERQRIAALDRIIDTARRKRKTARKRLANLERETKEKT